MHSIHYIYYPLSLTFSENNYVSVLLGAASQRVEILFLEWFGTDWVQDMVKEWKRKERGALFGIAECGVILYVISKNSVKFKAI